MNRAPITGPGGSTEPCNRRDRGRYAVLSSAQRKQVAAHATELYDGTRTLTRCWTEALDALTPRSEMEA